MTLVVYLCNLFFLRAIRTKKHTRVSMSFVRRTVVLPLDECDRESESFDNWVAIWAAC